MQRWGSILALWLFCTGLPLPAQAQDQGQAAGDFDLWVMALSWQPTWCALTGRDRAAAECAPTQMRGFVLHGLWPQYEEGWPSFCPTHHQPPSRAMTRAMEDIMGSDGLAWHQWRKHGVCSGLSAQAYFDLSRRAFEAIEQPALLLQVDEPLRLRATIIEEALREVNPTLTDAMIRTTCRDGHVAELRICLNHDLTPRACPRDMGRDCALQDARFLPVARP